MLRRVGRLGPALRHGRGLCSAPAIPDWASLKFDATPTRAMIRYNWTEQSGEWDAGTVTADFNVNIHGLSNVLHYGQAIFEGLKAFHGKDGHVRLFNATANAARLASGAARLAMPHVPEDMFLEAVTRSVTENLEYVPPYGYGGALYLRPFLFGHGCKLGLGAAPEYEFCVIASPVGAYYKGGLTPIDALVVEDFDRAAPRGVGGVKAAGNYAPDVLPAGQAKEQGFPICLYLDAREQKYIEEFSTSNFFGVTADGTLPSGGADPVCMLLMTRGVEWERFWVLGDKWKGISAGRCITGC